MDCIVHGVSKSWTLLSNIHFHFRVRGWWWDVGRSLGQEDASCVGSFLIFFSNYKTNSRYYNTSKGNLYGM